MQQGIYIAMDIVTVDTAAVIQPVSDVATEYRQLIIEPSRTHSIAQGISFLECRIDCKSRW
jgi:hypothetical protein